MSRKSPDAATLDALLLGAEDSDALGAWEDLLTTPGAADRWQEAVRRREHIDRFASALISHPWLARTMARVRSLRRPLALHASEGLEAVLAPELMATFLSPAAHPAPRLAVPRPGEVEPVPLTLGTVIELRPTPGQEGDFHVFYRMASGEGRLPRRQWRLEASEAPVLLLGVLGPGGASLEEALGRSSLLGGILLLEAPEPRE